MDNGWILYFETNNETYYFKTFRKLNDRPVFSKYQFKLFSNVMDIYDILSNIEKYIKLYGIPNVKINSRSVKLLVAHVNVKGKDE